MTAAVPADTVRRWLDEFAQSVRARDFVAGMALFDSSVFSFGTVTTFADGLDALVSQQWARVWPVTRGFRFADQPLKIVCSPDQRMAVVNALWTSEAADPNAPLSRSGRATIVLGRDTADGDWKAIHSHLSLSPLAQP